MATLARRDKQLHLVDLIEILFLYKRSILFFLVVALCGASLYLFQATKMYRSKTSIQLALRENKVVLAEQSRSSGVLKPTRFEFVQDEIQLLRSYATLAIVLEKMIAADDTAAMQRDVKAISHDLEIQAVNKTTRIDIRLKDPSPEFASEFLNELVGAYKSLKSELQNNSDIILYFDRQILSYQAEADSLGALIASVQEGNHIFDYTKQRSHSIESLGRLRVNLKELRRNLAERRIEGDLLSKARLDPYHFTLISDLFSGERVRNLNVIKSKLFDLNLEETKLKEVYLADNPKILAISDRRSDLIRNFEIEIAGLEQILQLELQSIQERIDLELSEEAAIRVELSTLSDASRDLVQLERKSQKILAVLDNLQAKRDELQIDSFVSGRSIQVTTLVPAAPAVKPYAPRTAQILIVVALASLLMSVMLAYYRRIISPVFLSPRDVEKTLNVPVIATIADVKRMR
jgi:uncharacterized protein involved in exopolysaccharide biosynthesis